VHGEKSNCRLMVQTRTSVEV